MDHMKAKHIPICPPLYSNISIALGILPINHSFFCPLVFGHEEPMRQDSGQRIKFRGPVSVPSGKSMPILEIRTFILTEPKVVPLLLWAFSSGYTHVMTRSSLSVNSYSSVHVPSPQTSLSLVIQSCSLASSRHLTNKLSHLSLPRGYKIIWDFKILK